MSMSSYRDPIWRAGEVARVVECLPSKREALSSNPNTGKKKNKKERGPI
jgi:hypothetical protein